MFKRPAHAAHALDQLHDVLGYPHIDGRAHLCEHRHVTRELHHVAVTLFTDNQQRLALQRFPAPFRQTGDVYRRVFARAPAHFVQGPAVLEIAAP